jgi:hypothetical protein
MAQGSTTAAVVTPSSASTATTIYASPTEYSATRPDTASSEGPDEDDEILVSPTNGDDSPESPKKKQKRNKPTLSCHECVERKTKVRCLSPLVSYCLVRLGQ